MIEIFLSEDYSKDLLKAYLEFIKKSASRELAYTINHFGKDVNIRYDTRYTKEEAQKISSFVWNKDDLIVFINDRSVNEYINGESVDVDTIYKFIKEM